MSGPRALLALCLGIVGASAACAPVGTDAADPSSPTEGFPWSERRLSWGDFRGMPPTGIPNIALTAYRWSVSVECVGPTFTYRIQSVFLPRVSWVATPLVSSRNSGRALRHEQTHFDLSEVHARRLRQFLAGLSDPCGESDGALKTLTAPFLAEDAAEQQRYDEQTRNGRDELRQAAWDEDIERRLEALKAYAD
jgi:hypothetical protein